MLSKEQKMSCIIDFKVKINSEFSFLDESGLRRIGWIWYYRSF